MLKLFRFYDDFFSYAMIPPSDAIVYTPTNLIFFAIGLYIFVCLQVCISHEDIPILINEGKLYSKFLIYLVLRYASFFKF